MQWESNRIESNRIDHLSDEYKKSAQVTNAAVNKKETETPQKYLQRPKFEVPIYRFPLSSGPFNPLTTYDRRKLRHISHMKLALTPQALSA